MKKIKIPSQKGKEGEGMKETINFGETRVFIKDKKHPWSGFAGVVESKNYIPTLKEAKYKVRLDNGMSSYASLGEITLC